MTAQIPLNLRPDRQPDFSNFHVSPGNLAAVNMLRARDRWTSPVLLLLGPNGSGKTHLGEAWKRRDGGEFLDDAHWLDETILFDAYNRALAGQSAGLVLASHLPPTQWNVTLPDLKSRLNATPTVTLTEHDEDTLEPILRELFAQAGRTVSADVVIFILKQTERSVDVLRDLVQELDIAAGAKKADLTKNFVSKYLKQRSELDAFPGPIE